MKKAYSLIICFIASFSVFAQIESPSWIDFANKRLSGDWGTNTLSDFSYAGYEFSEKPIPDISGWNRVDVTDYGAIPGDDNYDDQGIKDAIEAAENSNQPTVVFFPRGRYKMYSPSTAGQSIVIQKSKIVLKGEGSGSGGTEIFTDQRGDWAFHFKPQDVSLTSITNVSGPIKRGSYAINVNNTSDLQIGQIVELTQLTLSNVSENGVLPVPSNSYTDDWQYRRNGMNPVEKHVITNIEGNKVTFKNPVMLTMPDHHSTELRKLQTISQCGIEDIRFTGNWPSIGETFVHHKNDIHDYGWRGVLFENAYNSWIKKCEFKDWNEALEFRNSLALTVKKSNITGKRAHSSFTTKFCTGLFFENIEDEAGMQHGLSARRNSCGIVFSEYKMATGQSVDFHGSSPYANLLENTSGTFDRNGGNTRSYPNAGPYNTFWNFVHDATYASKHFNFWDTQNRKLYTFANPIFVGFTAPGENITFENEGKNELNGAKVYPYSLFDAQLQLRLFNGYTTASSQELGTLAKYANDNDDTNFWSSEGNGTDQWLMLDFGVIQKIDEIVIDEVFDIIERYKLEYWNGSSWIPITEGTTIGRNKLIDFTEIITRKIRLTFTQTLDENPVSIRKMSTNGTVVTDPNTPPTGTFKNPTFSTIEELYTRLYVEVEAEDDNGDSLEVTLKIDGSVIRKDVTAPFEWGHVTANDDYTEETLGLSPGEHKLEAVIMDEKGASTTISKTITVTERGVIKLSPIHDAYVQGTAGKNDDLLRLEADYRVVYMQFDMTPVIDKEIQSMNLQLTVAEDFGDGSITVYDSSNITWTESGINSSNAPSKENVLTTKTGPFGSGSTQDFDVSNMIFTDHKITFILESTGIGADDVSFASKENTAYARPVLRVKINEVLSVQEHLHKGKDFIFFPNPSTSGLFELDKVYTYQIYNLVGQLLIKSTDQIVDLSDFSKGTYFIKIKNRLEKLIKH